MMTVRRNGVKERNAMQNCASVSYIGLGHLQARAGKVGPPGTDKEALLWSYFTVGTFLKLANFVGFFFFSFFFSLFCFFI